MAGKGYEYNIRCKLCHVGFNPKLAETAQRKLCPNCLQVKKEEYKKFKESQANAC